MLCLDCAELLNADAEYKIILVFEFQCMQDSVYRAGNSIDTMI